MIVLHYKCELRVEILALRKNSGVENDFTSIPTESFLTV